MANDENAPLLPASSQHVHAQDSSIGAAESDDETLAHVEQMSLGRLALVIGIAYIGVLLAAIDQTIVATLSGPIASEFSSLSLLSYLVTAYLIASAACQPLSGRLTDIFGRGPSLVLCNMLFGLGNLICAISHSEATMILGRVVAGLGGGGLMSISSFLASDLVPLRARGITQGVCNLCWAAGGMLGGLFGGVFNDHSRWGWRLAFMIQVPFCLVSALLVALTVRVPPKISKKSYLARIDFAGVFLSTTFLVLLLFGLSSGGNLVPWLHPLPLTTIPISIVIFAAFIWTEYHASLPIIPIRLCLQRTVFASCMCNFFAVAAVTGALFHVPLYLQVMGDSATGAGLKIASSPVGVFVGSLTVGYIMKRTGRYVKLAIVGVAILALGIGILSFQGIGRPLWLSSVAFFVMGVGYGAMLTTTLLACLASVSQSHQAVITSATYMARCVGATIGITVASAVYQNILKARLWYRFADYPNAADELQRIRDDLRELKHLPDGWYPGVIASFMEAFRGIWLTLLAMSVLALNKHSEPKEMSSSSAINEVFVQTLNPIEQKARNGYARMAVLLPWASNNSYENAQDQLWLLASRYSATMTRLLNLWPMLGGVISRIDDDYGTLVSRFNADASVDAKHTLVQWVHQDQEAQTWEELMAAIGDEYFLPWQGAASTTTSVHPVTVLVTFSPTCTVLGFSFHQALFDPRSMCQFCSEFLRLTWLEAIDLRPNVPRCRGRSYIETLSFGHEGLTRRDFQSRSRRGMFPCFDFDPSLSRREPVRLVSRRVMVNLDKIIAMASAQTGPYERSGSRAGVMRPTFMQLASYGMLVSALMALVLVRSRLTSQSALNVPPRIRLNFVESGAAVISKDEQYMGNSSVMTTAMLDPRALFGLGQDQMPNMVAIGQRSTIADLEYVQRIISEATNRVNRQFVAEYVALKSIFPPGEEREAYERALGGGSLVFEDWMSAAKEPAGMPYAEMDEVPQVIPAASYATEPKVVILPRVGSDERLGRRCFVWFCEQADVANRAMTRLYDEGWIV
ncbi:hypothetical protein CDD82_2269 [Ophiocordyceps australis]|uniref:Major facilitator superfamily (MFS) profile domain-containing protein n=1 Tax=Ophiocordyceps australis TaxID=1399860 RepID=A0A2C5Y5Z2_9HYPO|nr:hypothetical protein CDD82_2269 [Ophiocordyceps australis]